MGRFLLNHFSIVNTLQFNPFYLHRVCLFNTFSSFVLLVQLQQKALSTDKAFAFLYTR